MAVVYRARDRMSGGAVAIKLFPTLATDAMRFEREVRVLAGLDHPAIVRYITHGTSPEGQLFLAMEWLEGEDLMSRLERAPLSQAESLVIAHRIAGALAAAHARGVVHRDVKPGNIFLPAGDPARATLLDFGIARVSNESLIKTTRGQLLGTPAYMAPEQVRGESNLDARSDVFAFGCVLYQCLSGRAPFSAPDLMGVFAKILFEEPRRLSELKLGIPLDLELLIERTLAKDRTERPADGAKLVDLLDALAQVGAAPAARPAHDSLTGAERWLMSVVLGGSPQDGYALGEAPTVFAQASRTSRNAVERAVAVYGANLDWLADGTAIAVLVFRGSASEHAARAARCALEMRQAGLHQATVCVTGMGTVTASRAPVGDVIDRAVEMLRRPPAPHELARSSGLAPIRIDDVTAGLLAGSFDIRGDGRSLLLQGEHPVATPPTVLGKQTPCVGRERELAMLLGLFDECRSELRAQVVLLVGAPGIGKTRLRQELVARLDHSGPPFELLIARGEPMSAGAPFGMLAPAIRALAGIAEGERPEVKQRKLRARLGRYLGADADRVCEFLAELCGLPPEHPSAELRQARQDAILMGDQQRRAFEDWLAAECGLGPVVILLEDLHLGDLPTVRFIDAALRHLAERPLFVLATARPEVNELFPDLFGERRRSELRLGELGRHACEMLARTVLGPAASPLQVTRLSERAGGNAFYLEELLRGASESTSDALPSTVVAMVQARLAALPAEVRRVLRAASVFGDLFFTAGVERLLGASAGSADVRASLETLIDREMIARRAARTLPGHDELVFRHALVREVVYGMLTEQDRKTGHQMAGEWLERAGAAPPLVLAEHFRRANDATRAISWYTRAGEQALEGNDFARALACRETALELGAEGPARNALDLVAATALRWSGLNYSEVVRLAEEALGREDPVSLRWFRLATLATEGHSVLGHTDQVAQWGERMTSAQANDVALDDQVICLAMAAAGLVFGGCCDSAHRIIERAQALLNGSTSDDPRPRARLLFAQACRALLLGDVETAVRFFERARSGFRAAGDGRNECAVIASSAFARTELGDLEAAEQELRDALRIAEQLNIQYHITVMQQNLGHVLLRLGGARQLAEATVYLGEALAALRRDVGDARLLAFCLIYMARVADRQGNLEEAESRVREALAVPELPAPTQAYALATLAATLLAGNRATEAVIAAREGQALLDSLGTLYEGEALIRLVWAESLEQTGDVEGAQAAIEEASHRLLARAQGITDPKLRIHFLERIEENARTLVLARQLAVSDR
jgi:tetratricopeptide (TPR) repeat protein